MLNLLPVGLMCYKSSKLKNKPWYTVLVYMCAIEQEHKHKSDPFHTLSGHPCGRTHVLTCAV